MEALVTVFVRATPTANESADASAAALEKVALFDTIVELVEKTR